MKIFSLTGFQILVFSLLIVSLVGCSSKEQEMKIDSLESSLREVERNFDNSEVEVEKLRTELADANLKVATLNATLAERISAEKEAKEARLRAEEEARDAKLRAEKEARDAKLRVEKEATNAKKKQDEGTLKNWVEVVSLVEKKQGPDGSEMGSLMDSTTARMTDNGRGIIFFDKQIEAIGLIGFRAFIEKLGIPDYILEDISNTRPINGRQEKTYENVVISWSIDRESAAYPYIEISLSLRLRD